MGEIESTLKGIETSTGTARAYKFETVCERLIELSTLRDRIQNDIDVLKDSIEAYQDRLPYKNETGEVIIESRASYEHDVKAIKKELPDEIFIECVTITKSRIKEAVTETNPDRRKDLIKQYTAIVEKHQTKRSGQAYIKVVTYKKGDKISGVLSVID